MKKLFAAVLSAAMIVGMAAVSFAASNDVADIDLRGPYRYDAENNIMMKPGEDYDVLRYGEGTYYLIMMDDVVSPNIPDASENNPNANAVISYKQMEKLRTKVNFQNGQDLVESVLIVKKYVEAGQVWGG